ncbi:conserved hypothetical protein [Beutenbergia cavernae DSM 12333]|uniref:Aminoglycoside phosphotransferase domain-containing protein n=1 Tax=Beutenbergia cavernae (strain ATCC BAA-8 / DSM 12333 / CCUG 43141 / JCM 11478 / NBRC 16432 / NCIMB 13614 / HKI 0122) TaxID=471853 RepID=C5BVQ7_BEUC1|nr:hypothetical protein [Beutenbergia cavernae]ACQ78497.1 conserved hypothetical protein [Beutenbergia cavernae DSM 12333]
MTDSLRDETLALAAAALGAGLTGAQPLGGSDRSVVLRARVVAGTRTDRLDSSAGTAHGRATTVIVKRFVAPGGVPAEFGRELVGLSRLDRTPSLLAVDEEHRLVVMSDLGTWPTLADLLLADDADAAWEGARGWAEALGDLLGASAPEAPAVAAELARRGAGIDGDLVGMLEQGARRVAELVGRADVPPELTAELAAITALVAPGPHDVVSPGDTCPDNAVLAPSGWAFLDLEGTATHHPALGAAYTVLPFATCWCVFDPPAGLTDDLLAAFTAGLGRHLPDVVAEPGWSRDVDLACAAWILLTHTWAIDGALASNTPIGPDGVPSPSRRQLLAGRWRWAVAHLQGVTPGLAALAQEALAWAEETWGADAAPAGPYRAFASQDDGSRTFGTLPTAVPDSPFEDLPEEELRRWEGHSR